MPQSFPRFLSLLRRLAPFLLVWLAIWALPAAREPLALQLVGSGFTAQYNPFWRRDVPPNPRYDSFGAVERAPRDLNARIWRFSEMLNAVVAGFGDDGQRNRKIYQPQQLRREGSAIAAAFPREKWLICLPLRTFDWQIEHWTRNNRRLSAAQCRQLRQFTRSAARQEPDNAYPWLIEAEIARKSRQTALMWQALSRAARCRRLESHDLEWAAAIVRAHEAVRPLILEEKVALWQQVRAGWRPSQELMFRLMHEARLSQNRNDHRRAIEIGVLMLRLGDLMQRGHNSFEGASGGQNWCSQARTLIYQPLAPVPGAGWWGRRLPKGKLWAKTFALYAAAHGRRDVAALERRLQLRRKQLSGLPITAATSGRITPAPQRDALWRAGWWRDAGKIVGLHLLFVAVLWVGINAVMWRGVGAPSSSIDRAAPALLVALTAAVCAWWSWQQWEILDAAGWTRWNPARERMMLAVGTVAVVSFSGAPFLLAIWVAVTTMWRHRREFFSSARVETELRLAPLDSLLLKSGPTILCTVSLLTTLGLWLLFLALVAFDIPTFDLLFWLPTALNVRDWSLSVPTEVVLAPLSYCLLLDGVGWVLWIVKWRFYSAQTSRAVTHGGLRRWKEILGLYLVIGSLLYLGAALCGWPARVAAHRELEIRMARGELPR
ncbi:MAG TPA: hypothetical protein VF627_06075 [Abditibacterium sp.]